MELATVCRRRAERLWQSWLEAAQQAGVEPPQDTRLAESRERVWGASEFVARNCIRHPELLLDLSASGELWRAWEDDDYRRHLTEALAGIEDEATLSRRLRALRRREMVRIAWRDLAGLADLAETTGDLSTLAECLTDRALALLDGWQRAEYGTPTGSDGRPIGLVVLGMGKLGARELNFSSDIDLIFAFAEEGETQGGPRSVSHEEYFTRLGRRLIDALDRATADGFVFRVDMRLRPFGSTSPLATSFDAMEEYYESQGREWERYAMIKARPIAGDPTAGEQLMARLRPFVYRRYLDYGAFESLREMKAMIASEVRRKGRQANLKLGPGGIREIEFIAQAFQLIRGGREPELQERRVLTVLQRLQLAGYLPDFVVQELSEAYDFLRRAEHRLQAYEDRQTHDLPAEHDQEGIERLACAMGYADSAHFLRDLDRHRSRVQRHFEQVFEAPQTRHAESDEHDLVALWNGLADDEAALATLSALGYEQPQPAYEQLTALRESHAVRALSKRGRERMDRLVPLAIGVCAGMEASGDSLQRLLGLVETIARRTAYLALLVENPMALSQLARLCGASPWIARLLTRHPLLLDELLDPRTLYAPPDRDEMAGELRQQLARVDRADLEQQMDSLRHFQQATTLRVAAADVSEAMPLMVVSDHLTWLAEVLVDEVLEIAWGHLVERHGRPSCDASGTACDKGFAVIAYGKMGGWELGYGSDLDLVFLHGSSSEDSPTHGERPIESAVFFARLGQRIIHILTSRTAAGTLYEVDTRLRPSGASGLLVSGIDAFAEYQNDEAWTWEHQALVRARAVAGDPVIAERFAEIRRAVLTRPRDPAQLRDEVRQMREKMRTSLGSPKAGEFDIKQDAGGIADIEFIVQYLVLRHAGEVDALLDWTDNIRILHTIAGSGLLPRERCDQLADAYRNYRRAIHRLTLQQQPARLPEPHFAEERAHVSAVWQQLFG